MAGEINQKVWIGSVIVSVVVVSDRVSKWVVMRRGVAVVNEAGVWGIGPGLAWSWVAVAVLVTVAVMVLRSRGKERWVWLVVMSAGISNWVDRLVWPGVIDWICYPVIGVCGNLADVWLGVGVIMLLVHSQQQNQKAKAKKQNGKYKCKKT